MDLTNLIYHFSFLDIFSKRVLKTKANIINGTQSVIGLEGLTVGFAAVNSSGTKGFVTAGHLSAGVGSSAKPQLILLVQI